MGDIGQIIKILPPALADKLRLHTLSFGRLNELRLRVAKIRYRELEEPYIAMNTVISKQIMERFYSALDAIIAMKKIRGVNTYCRLNNIDRRNFIAQRKDLERGWFQLSWLYPMVKEYGVSAKWLLTGFGRMFEEQK